MFYFFFLFLYHSCSSYSSHRHRHRHLLLQLCPPLRLSLSVSLSPSLSLSFSLSLSYIFNFLQLLPHPSRLTLFILIFRCRCPRQLVQLSTLATESFYTFFVLNSPAVRIVHNKTASIPSLHCIYSVCQGESNTVLRKVSYKCYVHFFIYSSLFLLLPHFVFLYSTLPSTRLLATCLASLIAW